MHKHDDKTNTRVQAHVAVCLIHSAWKPSDQHSVKLVENDKCCLEATCCTLGGEMCQALSKGNETKWINTRKLSHFGETQS